MFHMFHWFRSPTSRFTIPVSGGAQHVESDESTSTNSELLQRQPSGDLDSAKHLQRQEEDCAPADATMAQPRRSIREANESSPNGCNELKISMSLENLDSKKTLTNVALNSPSSINECARSSQEDSTIVPVGMSLRVRPSADIFVEAQEAILNLMEKDSYTRWKADYFRNSSPENSKSTSRNVWHMFCDKTLKRLRLSSGISRINADDGEAATSRMRKMMNNWRASPNKLQNAWRELWTC